MRSWIISAVLWVALYFGLPALPVFADAPNTPEAPSAFTASSPKPIGLDASSIPSEKMNQFVSAYLQVVSLIERREGELQGAETESESVRIQHDIEAEAIALIEKAGLSRQEYLQLLGLANVDSEFGERVATLLQESAS
ncbi:MAG: DUF4168 domain-containing protein [Leptolyngbyaceae cyanobacterium CSU_1_3]|nr:DUF4168 domain-containing protein [Leptolyngbyaceae cyanobacterium CSU_1_3]